MNVEAAEEGRRSRHRSWEACSLAAVLALFFGFFATGIQDIDLWSHLAAGRYIAETGSIPSADPFSMYAAPDAVRLQTVLRAQWLGQYLFYRSFAAFGAWGVIVLKALALTGCLVILLARARLRGIRPVPALAVLVLAGTTMLYFTGERPQVLAFLIASAVLLLLERYAATGKSRPLFLVPLLMALWANFHGSATLGAVVLVVYGIAHAADARWGGAGRRSPDARLLLVLAAGVLCTLLTPNGIRSYVYILQLEGSELQRRTSEYLTPVEVAFRLGRTAPTYWALVALAAGSVPFLLRERNLGALVMTVFMTLLGLAGWRYIPFFVLVSAPVLAGTVQRLTGRLNRFDAMLQGLAIAASLSLLAYGAGAGTVWSRELEKARFPAGIVDFAASQRLSGKAFTSFEWGGYLLWRMYPEVRPYIDGRVLDMNVFARYTHMLWATEQGLRFFEQERFDLVVLPRGNALTGERYPLPDRLLRDRSWELLYQDERGYLFRRSGTAS